MVKKLLTVMLCFVCSCGYFKVTNLSANKVGSIPSGTALSKVVINNNESGLLDLSFGVLLAGKRIYVKDNIQNKVLIYDQDNTCLAAIGNVGAAGDDKNVKKTHVKFDIIGAMVADSDNNLYVQNRLASARQVDAAGERVDMSPSFILVFDEVGNLQYAIGQTGTPTVPFYYIEHLEIDEKDRLFVIARTYDIWSVSRFDKRQRDYHITFSRDHFADTIDAKTTYTGRIENIRILQSGQDFILSVAYYDTTRFKYRKIFKYAVNDDERTELMKISEPKNELFAVVHNKYIYLWNVQDAEDVRFLVHNFDGALIGNVRCAFPQQALFSHIDFSSDGVLYSYHAFAAGLEVYEWK